MSAFSRIAGTQNEWITSDEVTLSVTGTLTGRCISPVTSPLTCG